MRRKVRVRLERSCEWAERGSIGAVVAERALRTKINHLTKLIGQEQTAIDSISALERPGNAARLEKLREKQEQARGKLAAAKDQLVSLLGSDAAAASEEAASPSEAAAASDETPVPEQSYENAVVSVPSGYSDTLSGVASSNAEENASAGYSDTLSSLGGVASSGEGHKTLTRTVSGYSEMSLALSPDAEEEEPEEEPAGSGGWAQELEAIEEVEERDFNSEFQRLIELPVSSPEERLERTVQLHSLARAFEEQAKSLAILIAERRLRGPRESDPIIPPVDAGGIAGGQKFRVGGIFLKFSVDEGLYGGDQFAKKAAGHELRGLRALYQSSLRGRESAEADAALRVPLFALIDHSGFRIMAMSTAPIGKRSLVYGSADAGRVIHSGDMEAARAMKAVGDRLNLAPHPVQDRVGAVHSLVGPVDIEVHRGADKRLYALDAARLFPAEAPSTVLQAACIPSEPYLMVSQLNLRRHVWKEDVFHALGLDPSLHGEPRVVLLSSSTEPPRAMQPLVISHPDLELIQLSGHFRGLFLFRTRTGSANYRLTDILASQPHWRVNLRSSPPAWKDHAFAPPGTTIGRLDASGLVCGRAILVGPFERARHLVNLLRPEALKLSKTPISSDAFTGFGRLDAAALNAPARELIEWVYSEQTLRFAELLVDSKLVPVTGQHLVDLMHSFGIPVRALALVRGATLFPVNVARPGTRGPSVSRGTRIGAGRRTPAPKIIFTEMMARCLKDRLNDVMRHCHVTTHRDEVFLRRKAIISLLNTVFSDSPWSLTFWTTDIKILLMVKFGGVALPPDWAGRPGTFTDSTQTVLSGITETHPRSNLKVDAQIVGLLGRLQAVCGAWLTPSANNRILTPSAEPYLFTEADLDCVAPVSKSISDDADVLAALREVVCDSSSPGPDEDGELDAEEILARIPIVGGKPDDIEAAFAYTTSVEKVFGSASQAHHVATFELSETLFRHGNPKKAWEYAHWSAMRLFADHSLPGDTRAALHTWLGNLARECGDLDVSIAEFVQALEILKAEHGTGVDHETVDPRDELLTLVITPEELHREVVEAEVAADRAAAEVERLRAEGVRLAHPAMRNANAAKRNAGELLRQRKKDESLKTFHAKPRRPEDKTRIKGYVVMEVILERLLTVLFQRRQWDRAERARLTYAPPIVQQAHPVDERVLELVFGTPHSVAKLGVNLLGGLCSYIRRSVTPNFGSPQQLADRDISMEAALLEVPTKTIDLLARNAHTKWTSLIQALAWQRPVRSG
jgi:hypothetical protein